MGCDGEVYGVYVAEVLRGGEEDAEQRVEAALSGAGADTDAAAAFVKAALQRVEALREEKISQAAAEEQHAAEEVQKLLQQGKTLRAQSQQQPAQEEEEEDLEERRRRQHLLHKYDLPNEMDMDADGKVSTLSLSCSALFWLLCRSSRKALWTRPKMRWWDTSGMTMPRG